jgi:5-(carboxyamino)imidazole ribonucleotide synthase
MFLVRQDGAETLVVNEIAPRVHNSGHWTIEGAVTSQFEQHVRAVCGWPLGSTARRGRIEMRNLLGDDVEAWPRLLAEPGAHLHLYGKTEARPGRKMGHVTRIFPLD